MATAVHVVAASTRRAVCGTIQPVNRARDIARVVAADMWCQRPLSRDGECERLNKIDISIEYLVVPYRCVIQFFLT